MKPIIRNGKIVNCPHNWVALPLWQSAFLWHSYGTVAKEYTEWATDIFRQLALVSLSLVAFFALLPFFPFMPIIRAFIYRRKGKAMLKAGVR